MSYIDCKVRDVLRWNHCGAGFTLLECVMAIGLVLMVTGIAWGVSSHVLDRGRRMEATAQLGILFHALERYRDHWGSYPECHPDDRMSGSEVLVKALLGNGASNPARGWSAMRPDGFVFSSDGQSILDPWGNPYLYASVPSWSARGFWLVSAGPDGLSTGPDEEGGYDRDKPENADDLLAGG